MHHEKEDLRQATKAYYLLMTWGMGVKKAFIGWRFPVLLSWTALFVLTFVGLLSSAPSGMAWVCAVFCAPLLLILFPIIFFFLGYVPGSWEMYDNFVRVGFVNAAGEPPLLMKRTKCGKGEKLVFFSRGLTEVDWHDKVIPLQSAMNLSIAEIWPGYDHQTVVVMVVPASTKLGTLIPWTNDYINYENDADFVLGRSLTGDVHINIDKQPMMLIGGSTGSGKTMLAIVILLQAIMRDTRVYIFDGKGLDYTALEVRDALVYTDYTRFLERLEDIVLRVKGRIDAFREAGAYDFRDYIAKTHDDFCKRIIVMVDECAEILDPTGHTKEEKETIAKITACLNTIARMGRAVGVHLIISTQRPDANAVPGSIKSNLDVRICGKADSTLSTIILGDGRADEAIPKYAQGRFIMADGAQDIVFHGFYYQR